MTSSYFFRIQCLRSQTLRTVTEGETNDAHQLRCERGQTMADSATSMTWQGVQCVTLDMSE